MATPAADAALLGTGLEAYSRERFLARLDEALAVTRRVLGEARCPVLPGGVDHAYADKYALVETTLSAAAASTLQALQAWGLDGAKLGTCREWAASGAEVTLRLRGSSRCAFAREEQRELALPQKVVVKEVRAGGAAPQTTRTSVSTLVTEYLWKFDAAWELDVYRGAGAQSLPLGGRSGSVELRTPAKQAPHAEAHTQVRTQAQRTRQRAFARKRPPHCGCCGAPNAAATLRPCAPFCLGTYLTCQVLTRAAPRAAAAGAAHHAAAAAAGRGGVRARVHRPHVGQVPHAAAQPRGGCCAGFPRAAGRLLHHAGLLFPGQAAAYADGGVAGDQA